LVFDRDKFKYEDKISETFSSATELDLETIRKLAERYRWFGICGSIRIPGRRRLYDLSIFLYPTFDSARSACIVILVDSSLYDDVYGEDDDIFDGDAADILLRLIVLLGANDQVDGFQARLIEKLSDIKPFDGIALRQSLLEPTPIRDSARGAGLPHGFVTGIKSSILSSPEIERIWADAAMFETVNGFSILNGLIEIENNEGLLDKEEND
jgi:hypothetical protein